MKRIIVLLACSILFFSGKTQNDTTKVKVGEQNVVTVVEDSIGTKVKVGSSGGIEVIANHAGDTVRIRIGNRTFDVIDGDQGAEIKTSRIPKEERRSYNRFNGHWGGFELGFNSFHQSDYSMYEGEGYGEFFDLNYGKSLTVNLNIAEFAFSNDRKTVGVLSGLGFSFMDFRFDNDITVQKEHPGNWLVPVPLEEVTKSKLNVAYLTAPLILEIGTPLKFNAQRLTLAAGVIGGLNIGSHTKIKYSGSKDKERGNFNINPLKYELTGRLGLGEFCLFANYAMTPLFKDMKGPELYPLTIGLSFPNISF